MIGDDERLDEVRKAAYSRWEARKRWGNGADGNDRSDWFAAENRVGRFFYHSFPRVGRGTQAELDKGLEILAAMADVGLVLTPEVHDIREQEIAPGRSAELKVVQQRLCLTDLCPAEVPWHAHDFGAFSLEFDVETARGLGAFPVFYFPNKPGDAEAASWYGRALLARVGYVVNVLLQRLKELEARVEAAIPNRDAVVHTLPGGEPVPAIAGAHVLGELLGYQRGLVYTPTELERALRTTSSLWGPTENLKYGSLMYYYRQREWRIVAGLERPGYRMHAPTDAEADRLKAIDPGYFGRVLELPPPTGTVERVRACQALREVDGRHILTYVRRFVVPGCVASAAEAVLRRVVPAPVVVPIESLW